MKVCVTFHNDIFTPWPATSIIHPVETLLEAGHKVLVLSWDKGRDVSLNDVTLPVERDRIIVPVRNSRSFFEFSQKLAERLMIEKPDLVLAFDLEVLRGSAVAADSLNIPLLYFAREDWPSMVRGNGDFISSLRSRMFHRIEKTVCKKSVEHAYSVNDERGKKYVEWGIPYTTIYTTRGLSELPENLEKTERFSIALAGSMHEILALPNILKAMEDIDCDLYLIGGSESDVATVKGIVSKSSVSDRVIITGKEEPADFYKKLARCHVGLSLPYKTDMNKYYGITVKTWDYMAMGMPSVVSDFPTMKSLVVGNGIGVAVDPTSSEQIRDAILELKPKAAELGRTARKLFVEKYSWDKQKEILKESHWVFRGNKPIS